MTAEKTATCPFLIRSRSDRRATYATFGGHRCEHSVDTPKARYGCCAQHANAVDRLVDSHKAGFTKAGVDRGSYGASAKECDDWAQDVVAYRVARKHGLLD